MTNPTSHVGVCVIVCGVCVCVCGVCVVNKNRLRSLRNTIISLPHDTHVTWLTANKPLAFIVVCILPRAAYVFTKLTNVLDTKRADYINPRLNITDPKNNSEVQMFICFEHENTVAHSLSKEFPIYK